MEVFGNVEIDINSDINKESKRKDEQRKLWRNSGIHLEKIQIEEEKRRKKHIEEMELMMLNKQRIENEHKMIENRRRQHLHMMERKILEIKKNEERKEKQNADAEIGIDQKQNLLQLNAQKDIDEHLGKRN